MHFDLPLPELQKYTPPRNEPQDFDDFWAKTISETKQFPLNAQFEKIECGLKLVDVHDVTYSGYNGQRIKGWFILPAGCREKLPCVIEYIGYGGGRGLPTEWLLWSACGYAHFIMDTRGQGSVWRAGDTPDPEPDTTSPQHPGFMTRGIYNKDTYYYRRVFSDALRAVEAAKTHEYVDEDAIVVSGISQGGGIALAVSGLVKDCVGVMADVPFLCDFRRAVTLVDTEPYHEIVQFLKVHRDKTGQVFDTLGYFDGMNFAARAQAPALFSVGLMDDICPPSTVFAAYNHYRGEKKIRIWPYNKHEGGQQFQDQEKIGFMQITTSR